MEKNTDVPVSTAIINALTPSREWIASVDERIVHAFYNGHVPVEKTKKKKWRK